VNRYAYLATGHAIALMEALSKVNVNIHGRELIPDGSIVFVVNHFTRIETLLLPYHIYHLTNRPVWSLADASMFSGALGQILETLGNLSTKAPDRDRVIVKDLLTGEANWIIFPEGSMVKDKAIVESTRYAVSLAGVRRQPHTGAATLSLRTEFYRRRLRRMAADHPEEAERLRRMFGINNLAPVLAGKTSIVPVNITYYPLRARENALSRLAELFLGPIAENYHEELLTEGAMLLEGVDIDIRFGKPIDVGESMDSTPVEQDIFSREQIDFDDPISSRMALRHEGFKLMRRYMTAIYELTTINHDHLFASLLRSLPFRKFSAEDFRRRIYLLANSRALAGLYRHQSLEIGQVALLTDDRHHKFSEFLSLAVETGVVRRERNAFIKDPAKFSSKLDLNRARTEDPIGVVANEVLPLKSLQGLVLFYAWMPEFLVGKLVLKQLLSKAEQEFEADYRTFFRTGESKSRDVGKPQLIKGISREVGILLVHGFLAAPRELSELAEYLKRQGVWVYLVRLKGHGTSPDDLVLRTVEDWRDSVDSGYAVLRMVCRKVIIVGFSFGGGLALDCAARNSEVAGVVVVCPPMDLRDFTARIAPSIHLWNKLMAAMNYQKGKWEFVDIVPEHPEINYSRLPMAGLVALKTFMEELEEALPGITTPTLTIQAKGDPVVDPEGSQRMFKQLGSAQKEYHLLDFVRHGILSGEGSDQVFKLIGEFIDRIRTRIHI
jgi:esterase/lipase/1-acyl-sn-glycerol-3-phosphate acyltransferase